MDVFKKLIIGFAKISIFFYNYLQYAHLFTKYGILKISRGLLCDSVRNSLSLQW